MDLVPDDGSLDQEVELISPVLVALDSCVTVMDPSAVELAAEEVVPEVCEVVVSPALSLV